MYINNPLYLTRTGGFWYREHTSYPLDSRGFFKVIVYVPHCIYYLFIYLLLLLLLGIVIIIISLYV